MNRLQRETGSRDGCLVIVCVVLAMLLMTNMAADGKAPTIDGGFYCLLAPLAIILLSNLIKGPRKE